MVGAWTVLTVNGRMDSKTFGSRVYVALIRGDHGRTDTERLDLFLSLPRMGPKERSRVPASSAWSRYGSRYSICCDHRARCYCGLQSFLAVSLSVRKGHAQQQNPAPRILWASWNKDSLTVIPKRETTKVGPSSIASRGGRNNKYH
jgi:hypothetical protein